ncbi:helix-turn-helix domain-containing protein [Nocardia crassostreae]|uniref:helix-turn-helix domain-containing protein n=1 Tax=Nocardia crassostreae TaxID=53428 RepID=UPI00083131AE|nr:helix-turn-helix transcriptional regulator [Nocardia crassostreae]
MAGEDSTLPRRQLGRFLRQYRKKIGLTMAQAAQLVEIGTSTLHRIERGTADKVRPRLIERLCEIYERSNAEKTALKQLAEQAAAETWYHEFSDLLPDHFDDYVGLEASARQLISYQELVPGLLQIEQYARTMMHDYTPATSDRDIERHVALRIRRQTIVRRRAAPVELDVVLHESALRRVVGSPKIMANQSRHLADASTWPNVAMRVLPFTAGIPMGMLPGPFVILDCGFDSKGRPVEPTVVYVESVITAHLYLQKEADVERYRAVSAALHAAALDPVDTRALLRSLAKEYELWAET